MDRYDITITPRELKAILYDIDNQGMTVAELRAILTRIDDDYDKPFSISVSMSERINRAEREK